MLMAFIPANSFNYDLHKINWIQARALAQTAHNEAKT